MIARERAPHVEEGILLQDISQRQGNFQQGQVDDSNAVNCFARILRQASHCRAEDLLLLAICILHQIPIVGLILGQESVPRGPRSLVFLHIAVFSEKIQTTLDLAANLGTATATLLTDLRHYIIATLDLTTSNFGPYLAKQRPSTLMEVAKSSEMHFKLFLATTWS